MARTQVGTGRLAFDFTLLKEDNGALVYVTKGHMESSTGLNHEFTHELSERSYVEFTPQDKNGKPIAKYRLCGADPVEIPRVGKNGVVDGPVRKFGNVKPTSNAPLYTKVVGDVMIPGDGKYVVVTDALLGSCRSITNAAWDSIFFSLTQDGVASESTGKTSQPAVIGAAILKDYRATLEASAAMVKDAATFTMWAMFSSYAGGATNCADAINELVDAKAATLRAEWEAKKAASDKATAEREAANAVENAKLTPKVPS